MLRLWGWIAVAAVALVGRGGLAQPPSAARVEVELGLEAGFPPTEVPRWYDFLSKGGLDGLRIGGPADPPRLETGGVPGAPTYRARGYLSARGECLLPGARLSLGNTAALKQWVERVRTSGTPSAAPAARTPFGLSGAQLDLARADLARPIDFATADLELPLLLEQAGNRLRYPLVASRDTAGLVSAAGKAAIEVKGLALGTGLAAVLRRAGLALVPRLDAQGQLEYLLADATRVEELWPVGWKPERTESELLPPAWGELRNVEINDVPLGRVVAAIAGKVGLPVVYDEQALVRYDVDLATSRVSLPARQMNYPSTLRLALQQRHLDFEVRVDDGGRPLLWIRGPAGGR